MLTFEVAAKGDFKISCPAQPSTVHARATACPESLRTECSTTSSAGPRKGTQSPIQTWAPGPQHPQSPVPLATRAPHPDKPVQPPAQVPLYYFKHEFNQPDRVSPSQEAEHSEVPQLPQKADFLPTQSPLGLVPKPVQFPTQFPLYFFKPEFYQIGPKPDHLSPSPEPEHSEVPQHPQTPVFQPTPATPAPVHHKKPELVEDPSKSMPDQFPQFPFYFLEPEFHHHKPKLNPKPSHSPPSPELDLPHHPLTLVSQPTQTPIGPVYPKQPALVVDPYKSMFTHTPKPAQFAAQFPNFLFKPEFYQPDPKPEMGSPSPKKPKCTEEPKLPQRPVPQTSHARLVPVYPTMAPSVKGDSKGLLPSQLSLAQFPVYFFNNTIYLPHSKPDGVPAITEPEASEVPQIPQIPGPQATQVSPKQPVTHPPPTSPRHAHSPAEAPIGHVYQFYPVIYLPHPNSGHSVPSPSQKPKMPIAQSPNLVPTPKTEPESIPSLPSAPKNEEGTQTPPEFEDLTTLLESPDRVHHQSTHCITTCTVAHSNCCPLALSFHQHVHHHNHFAPAFGKVAQPAPASSDKEPSFIQLLMNHSLISNGNKQVPHTFLGTPQSQPASNPSVQTGSYQVQEAKPVHMPKPDPAVEPIPSPAHPINLPFLNSFMHIPTNGQWSLVPVVTPSSVQLTQLPASKIHNNQPVKEPPPYQELQYHYAFPNSKSTYSSGPDNPANSPETMSVSTAETRGLHRDPVVEAHQSTVKHSLAHPLFQIPYFGPYPPPTSKPDSQTETETIPHQSMSSSVMLSSKSTKKSVPQQWGWHPVLNSFLRPNMEGGKQNIPDMSSDSPHVPSGLSKYSNLKHPVASSEPAPQKLYWHRGVPPKATAYNGYPKAPFKSDASNPYPQNNISSPQHVISSANGESFAPLGSPQSFKDYWKRVGAPHS